jgi:hypothetical protein
MSSPSSSSSTPPGHTSRRLDPTLPFCYLELPSSSSCALPHVPGGPIPLGSSPLSCHLGTPTSLFLLSGLLTPTPFSLPHPLAWVAPPALPRTPSPRTALLVASGYTSEPKPISHSLPLVVSHAPARGLRSQQAKMVTNLLRNRGRHARPMHCSRQLPAHLAYRCVPRRSRCSSRGSYSSACTSLRAIWYVRAAHKTRSSHSR